MPLHDTSYQHWDGVHLGVWSRRWVIALNGIKGCLQNRALQYLVVLCWVAGLALAAVLFALGQLLVPDSIIVHWLGNLNPNLRTFAALLTSWLDSHPELSVGTTQNVLFFYAGVYILLRPAIFALGMALPHLVTRDLASNAIIIYSSKAVTRGDYLFGKFATAAGLVLLTWVGPLCAAWFLGNFLAPRWGFFWHARAALFHVLLFGVAATCFLSALALGVSAISPKEKSTTALWFTWWVVGGFIALVAMQTRPWLQHVSFNYNLYQIGLGIFRPGGDLNSVQENIPIFSEMLRNVPMRTLDAINNPPVASSLAFLLVMLVAAAAVINKRAKPE